MTQKILNEMILKLKQSHKEYDLLRAELNEVISKNKDKERQQRIEFAKAALNGFIGIASFHYPNGTIDLKEIAEQAFGLADAMIKEMNK